ncbi:MAG: hypothetical protein NPINA01_17710 [Nitrospinaceae bacterium]|nr:MAG: hypothetical protein NPINA01_17710 [Nitrospinaceae bacterium]
MMTAPKIITELPGIITITITGTITVPIGNVTTQIMDTGTDSITMGPAMFM